jgi:hypothetical protein
MRRWRAFALLLALSVPSCFPDAAHAVGEIEGPDSVPVYQLATVSTGIEADGYIWLGIPFETTFSADQANPKVLQFTGTPGPHTIVLIPLKGGKPAGQFRKTVTFGPAPFPPQPQPNPPGPVPPQPNPPTPGLGLRAYVLDVVSRNVPVAERASGAPPIAAAYREAVRLARDGKFASPQVMVTYVAEAMKTARPASWSGFVLAPKLTELVKAGKLATVGDLVIAFEEIALALDEVAGG